MNVCIFGVITIGRLVWGFAVGLLFTGKEPTRPFKLRGTPMVGELGFFLRSRRTASVIADEPGIVHGLGRSQWEAMVA